MPRPDFTDITLVLDRSGSMQAIQETAIAAFNTFVKDQRGGVGTAHLSLVQFDNEYEVLYEALPIQQAPELNTKTFVPRGTTALLDAMGRTILRTGQRLAAMPEAERPGNVVFVTLTDGQENSSTEFTLQRINAMITEQRNIYSWQFIFLGANQDAIATAADMGIARGHAMTFGANAAGTLAAMQVMSPRLLRNRRQRAEGQLSPMEAFDEEDRAAALGEDEPDKQKGKKRGK